MATLVTIKIKIKNVGKKGKCRDYFHYLNKRGYMTSLPFSEGAQINIKPSLITQIHTNPEHCLAHP